MYKIKLTITRFATNKPIYYFLASPIQNEQGSSTYYIKLFNFIQTVNIFNMTNCWYRHSPIPASFLSQLIKQNWNPNKPKNCISIKCSMCLFYHINFKQCTEEYFLLFLVKFVMVLWIETFFSILWYPIFCLKLKPSFYTIKVVNQILQ